MTLMLPPAVMGGTGSTVFSPEKFCRSVSLNVQEAAVDHRKPVVLFIAALVMVVFLGGMSPRVDPLDQRWKAIRVTSLTLDAMGTPNVALRLSAKPVEPQLATFAEKQVNTIEALPGMTFRLSATNVEFQRQFIALKSRIVLKTEEPPLELEGEIIGGAAPALLPGSVRLFPVFTSFDVERVRMGEDSTEIDPSEPGVSELLGQVLDLINGSLNRKPFVIPFDLAPVASLDPRPQLAAIDGLTDVTGKPIAVAYSLLGSAVLVDPSGLDVLAELSLDARPSLPPVADVPPPDGLTEAAVDADFAAVAERFSRLRSTFAGPPPENALAWAAVSKTLVAEAINTALRAPELCASYELRSIRVPYNVEVETFKSDPIDCSPTVSCGLEEDRRDCRRPKQCERKHDTRNCGRFDPFCEAGKAAQNAIYEAEFTLCQATPQFIVDAQCEAEKAAANFANKIKHDACELDKTRLRGQCELFNEAVKQLEDVANVSGEMELNGKPRMCVSSIQAAADLSSVIVSATVAADALNVAGSLHYAPVGIPGHLGCPAEFTRDIRATVHVPAQGFAATIPIRFQSTPEHASISFEIPQQTLGAQMQPAPFDALFAAHPDLAVVCPGPAGILGGATLLNAAFFAARGEDLVPELRGNLTLETKALPQSLIIDRKTVTVGAEELLLVPAVKDRSLEFAAIAEAHPGN